MSTVNEYHTYALDRLRWQSARTKSSESGSEVLRAIRTIRIGLEGVSVSPCLLPSLFGLTHPQAPSVSSNSSQSDSVPIDNAIPPLREDPSRLILHAVLRRRRPPGAPCAQPREAHDVAALAADDCPGLGRTRNRAPRADLSGCVEPRSTSWVIHTRTSEALVSGRSGAFPSAANT